MFAGASSAFMFHLKTGRMYVFDHKPYTGSSYDIPIPYCNTLVQPVIPLWELTERTAHYRNENWPEWLKKY